VVIEREEAEQKTKGGIVLPDSAKDKPTRGKVISVGAGKLLDDGNGRSCKSRRAIACCSAPTPATPSSWASANCC